MLPESTLSDESSDISREEIQQRLRDPSLVVVDALPAGSFAGGHLPGAISLPLADIPARARAMLPDQSAEIAVYCAKFT